MYKNLKVIFDKELPIYNYNTITRIKIYDYNLSDLKTILLNESEYIESFEERTEQYYNNVLNLAKLNPSFKKEIILILINGYISKFHQLEVDFILRNKIMMAFGQGDFIIVLNEQGHKLKIPASKYNYYPERDFVKLDFTTCPLFSKLYQMNPDKFDEFIQKMKRTACNYIISDEIDKDENVIKLKIFNFILTFI